MTFIHIRHTKKYTRKYVSCIKEKSLHISQYYEYANIHIYAALLVLRYITWAYSPRPNVGHYSCTHARLTAPQKREKTQTALTKVLLGEQRSASCGAASPAQTGPGRREDLYLYLHSATEPVVTAYKGGQERLPMEQKGNKKKNCQMLITLDS